MRRLHRGGRRIAAARDGPGLTCAERRVSRPDSTRRHGPVQMTGSGTRDRGGRRQNGPMTEPSTLPPGLFAADDQPPARCQCGAARGARIPALPRRGVGLPGDRRAAPVRKNLPRRFSGGLELAHHPQQARGVSPRLREFRCRAGGPVRRGGRHAPARRCRHRAPPRQDRVDHQQRTPGRRAARRVRLDRRPTRGATSPTRRRARRSCCPARRPTRRPRPSRCRRT